MRSKRVKLNGVKYLVREDGKVFSVSTGEEIKQRLDACKYSTFTTGKKGNRKTVRTHRVVAKAFCPNPDNLPEVDHLDGIRTNASADNLQWVTHRENIIRSHKRGNCNRTGTHNGRAKLNELQVMCLRVLYDEHNMSIAELARLVKRGHSTILNIVHRYTWTHI